jgi:hypothetical protein
MTQLNLFYNHRRGPVDLNVKLEGEPRTTIFNERINSRK